MIVHPYQRLPQAVAASLPENWIIGKSDSDWMQSPTFFEYMANGFNDWLTENNIKRPILCLVDGHKSHLTMHLSEFCDKHGIISYSLLPNATHIIKSADLSVFKPLKSEWKKNSA
uniref:DDE-1 domain-containing protein n=1 Tax=Trichogramma kaykai TaxID=54128 RepID=A0ABD2VZF8_9HYME